MPLPLPLPLPLHLPLPCPCTCTGPCPCTCICRCPCRCLFYAVILSAAKDPCICTCPCLCTCPCTCPCTALALALPSHLKPLLSFRAKPRNPARVRPTTNLHPFSPGARPSPWPSALAVILSAAKDCLCTCPALARKALAVIPSEAEESRESPTHHNPPPFLPRSPSLALAFGPAVILSAAKDPRIRPSPLPLLLPLPLLVLRRHPDPERSRTGKDPCICTCLRIVGPLHLPWPLPLHVFTPSS